MGDKTRKPIFFIFLGRTSKLKLEITKYHARKCPLKVLQKQSAAKAEPMQQDMNTLLLATFPPLPTVSSIGLYVSKNYALWWLISHVHLYFLYLQYRYFVISKMRSLRSVKNLSLYSVDTFFQMWSWCIIHFSVAVINTTNQATYKVKILPWLTVPERESIMIGKVWQ